MQGILFYSLADRTENIFFIFMADSSQIKQIEKSCTNIDGRISSDN
jgi:hypothetical protein